jgi:hypothetical protein
MHPIIVHSAILAEWCVAARIKSERSRTSEVRSKHVERGLATTQTDVVVVTVLAEETVGDSASMGPYAWRVRASWRVRCQFS